MVIPIQFCSLYFQWFTVKHGTKTLNSIAFMTVYHDCFLLVFVVNLTVSNLKIKPPHSYVCTGESTAYNKV